MPTPLLSPCMWILKWGPTHFSWQVWPIKSIIVKSWRTLRRLPVLLCSKSLCILHSLVDLFWSNAWLFEADADINPDHESDGRSVWALAGVPLWGWQATLILLTAWQAGPTPLPRQWTSGRPLFWHNPISLHIFIEQTTDSFINLDQDPPEMVENVWTDEAKQRSCDQVIWPTYF